MLYWRRTAPEDVPMKKSDVEKFPIVLNADTARRAAGMQLQDDEGEPVQ
mgnify:CR=1 FL=1